MNVDAIKKAVRDVPDFPTKGIVFKDITPVVADPRLFGDVVDSFADRYRDRGVDAIAAIESRGFIFGAAVAYKLGCSLVPVRKEGKLPWKTVKTSYQLEYGTATLEMHRDAVRQGAGVLIMDDLLATGGTAAAAASLVEQIGGRVIEMAFLIELAFLEGRRKLQGYSIYAPVVF